MNARPDLSVANSARAASTRARAAKLIAVASSEADIYDVITESTTSRGRALLRITLRQLLLAVPGWGNERAARIINQTLTVLNIRPAQVSTRRLTIAWLIDPRAGGRRFMAFCDSLKDNSSAPWAGFPFMPKPSSAGTRGAA